MVDGEWVYERQGVETYQPYFIGLSKTQLQDYYDEGYLFATQNLFNNDDKYEYLTYIVEAVDYKYENLDLGWRVSGQKLAVTGIKIMSEDGTTLNTVRFPDGYSSLTSTYYYHLVTLGDKNYLSIMAWDENDDRYALIYAIDSSNNSVKSVGAPIKVKVHPTAPQRGESVNVDLSEELTQGAIINVTSASGNVVMTQKVAAGTNRATIDTSSLQRGMYIVTVNNGKATRENTKIIIR